jgi:hypothetical protein
VTDADAELLRALERVEQLETALDSRVVIEQAKGILAERYQVSVDSAFALLRYAARSSRTPIHELALRVARRDGRPIPARARPGGAPPLPVSGRRRAGTTRTSSTSGRKRSARSSSSVNWTRRPSRSGGAG